MAREPFVKASYDPADDQSLKPTGNFTDEVNRIVNDAQAARRKKKRYGRYNSAGAQSTPETRRLTRRITGERDD